MFNLSIVTQRTQKFMIGLVLLASLCDGFIAPLEVVRFQENILLLPPIFKGTDSRLGFGFRLGRHADFQSIFEIGPQKITKPLEKRGEDEYSSSSKRMATQFEQPKVVELPRPESSKDEYYIRKRSFSTRNQFPIPKSMAIPKSPSQKDYERNGSHSKPITRKTFSKMTEAPIPFMYRRNPGKFKKYQQIKDESIIQKILE